MKIKPLNFLWFILAVALIMFGLIRPLIVGHKNKKQILKAVANKDLIQAKENKIQNEIKKSYENIDSLNIIRDSLHTEIYKLTGSNLQARLSSIFE